MPAENKKRRILDVAGAFKVDLDEVKQSSRTAVAVVELYELLKNFFCGSEEEKFRALSKVFLNAKLENGVLSFSFPKKVKEQYKFKSLVFRVRLSMGRPTAFYATELMPHLNNDQCEILISGLCEKEQEKVQKFLWRMTRKKMCLGLRELGISKYGTCFGASMKFASGKKIRIKDLQSLDEALECIRDNIR